MAERKSADDDFNPRHRIVGAIVLVALAVIFLPLLLSERPPEAPAPAASDVPVAETPPLVVPATPAARPDTHAKPVPVQNSTPQPGVTRMVTVPVPVDGAAPGKPVSDRKPVVEAVVPAEPVRPEPAATPEAKPAEPKPSRSASAEPRATSGEKGWVVQVGAFSSADNARRLQEKLKQKGYPVFLDPPSPQKGKVVRVDVGPYKDASSAKTVQARLQSELGINGLVRNHP